MTTLSVYAVRNAAGEWFRSVGYGGGGKQWVPDIMSAKLYQRIGQARGRVTFYANHFPAMPRPVIVEFSMSLADAKVIDETERVTKTLAKKARETAQRAEDDRLRNVEYAKQQLKAAKKRISELEKNQ